MNEIEYQQMDIVCDRCRYVGAGNIVNLVAGWAHVKCASCGWTSSHKAVAQ